MIRLLSQNRHLLYPICLPIISFGIWATNTYPLPHRVLFPIYFGQTEISENIFIDDPSRTDVLNLVQLSEERITPFFGDIHSNPRYVICTTSICDEIFGVRFSGSATPGFGILISSKGLNEAIFVHERVHAELHERIGTVRLPIWFNEGVAVYLSSREHKRPEVLDDAIENVKELILPMSWTALHFGHPDGLALTYTPAYAAILDLVDEIGRTGLRDVIARMEKGETLDAALAAIRAGSDQS
ncbi:MAG: hypothetical protein AAGJ34_00500 [Pseudomonadota bacterium]